MVASAFDRATGKSIRRALAAAITLSEGKHLYIDTAKHNSMETQHFFQRVTDLLGVSGCLDQANRHRVSCINGGALSLTSMPRGMAGKEVHEL